MRVGEIWKCRSEWCAMGDMVKITHIFTYNVEFSSVQDDERILFPRETFLEVYEKVYDEGR